MRAAVGGVSGRVNLLEQTCAATASEVMSLAKELRAWEGGGSASPGGGGGGVDRGFVEEAKKRFAVIEEGTRDRFDEIQSTIDTLGDLGRRVDEIQSMIDSLGSTVGGGGGGGRGEDVGEGEGVAIEMQGRPSAEVGFDHTILRI